MAPRSRSRRRALVVVGVVVGLAGVAAACGSDTEVSDYEPQVRPPTTRPGLSAQASEEFQRQLEAARTSSTTLPGGPSSTTSTTVVTSSSSTSSTRVVVPGGGGASRPPTGPSADDCKLFAQLFTFVGQVDPLIVPNDPAATAAKVAGPVAQSQSGFEQLQAAAPAEVSAGVRTVISWLRDLAAGTAVDDQPARQALAEVKVWYRDTCAGGQGGSQG